jgi:23S rRNA-/tRNA-specific pseudouridylate synthase
MKEQIVYEDNHLLVVTKKSDSLYRVIKPVMNHYWNYQRFYKKRDANREMFSSVWFIVLTALLPGW